MNWYKLKLAEPLIETPEMYSRYYDFGHKQKNIILWFIDNKFNFHTTPVSKEIEKHYHWNEYEKNFDNIFTQGRYDPNEHTSSLYYGFMGDMMPKRKEYIKRRLETMVDKKFNNPKIIPFNN